jgi:hypothetical protein
VNTSTTVSPPARAPGAPLARGVRDYFFSDSRRTVQTVLGLAWLLDAGLQFQPFMYSNGFVQMLTAVRPGQPHWVAGPIGWATGIAHDNLDIWNTLFALTQLAIGLGLLYRPTVKPALAVSFGWALSVWFVGEGLGMLFASAASPLTGAPGAVLLYGLIGLIVWPNRPGGLLGASGARIAWGVLWVVMGLLWLLPANSSANAISNQISSAPSNMSWLTSLQTHAANAARDNGLLIALALATVSVAIGIAATIDWQARTFLWLAISLNVTYWVIGQGFGGIQTGTGTDPNAGPLFILLVCTLFPLLPTRRKSRAGETRAHPSARSSQFGSGVGLLRCFNSGTSRVEPPSARSLP